MFCFFILGNYLGSAWLDILKCISQLELAQLAGSGHRSAKDVSRSTLTWAALAGISNDNTGNDPLSLNLNSLDRKKHFQQFILVLTISKERFLKFWFVFHIIASVKESIGETSSQSVVVAVDRIFTGSTRLDGDAIVDFVKALCQVRN